MSSTNSFSVLSNNQKPQRSRTGKPHRKSSESSSAKVGSSARSGSSGEWKTKTRGSSRSSRSSASRPSRSRGKYSNSRVPKAEESKKELEVLTLPKIQNPVYLKLAQKELPSLKSKSVNDIPEKVASNPLSSYSYPELSQIINANQISRKKFIQRDIERWARKWKNELRYIHSTFVPDFDYRDFVEVAYSTTPKNASFHRTLHICEDDLGYPHAPDREIDSYSYKNMNNIMNYCQERVLPFFRDIDVLDLDIFDRDDQDSCDSYNVTPREDCEDDDDWFNHPLGW